MYKQQLPQALDSITATTASNRTLLAASTGVTWKVAYVFISASAATTVTFKSATSNLRWEMHVSDDGGVSATAPPGLFLFKSNVGEAITWSSDKTADVFVSILYASE